MNEHAHRRARAEQTPAIATLAFALCLAFVGDVAAAERPGGVQVQFGVDSRGGAAAPAGAGPGPAPVAGGVVDPGRGGDAGAAGIEALDLATLDRDGDGEVTEQEATVAGGLPPERFSAIDSDHNGRLDAFELETYRQRQRNDAERDADRR